MTGIKLPLGGMHNKNSEVSIPEGKVFNAYNVMFDNSGRVLFPRTGKRRVYTGLTHSVFKTPFVTLFVEDGKLSRFNGASPATVLLEDCGDTKMFYTVIGKSIYFTNEDGIKGIVNDPYSSVIEWGVQRPPMTMTVTAIGSGGLYEGTYRVTLTWIGSETESGAVNSISIDVQEGGGISLTDLPIPPDYVMLVGVYVSSTNGEDLYLYDEYLTDVTEITIGRLNSDGVVPDILLETQFMYPPVPESTIVSHYGRIYYALENMVYWTVVHRYSLQSVNSFWTFDSEVQTIISCPTVLYVGTQTSIYKIVNIDSEDSAPVIEKVNSFGTTKYSECYDTDDASGYCMSQMGIIKFTPASAEKITDKDVVMPLYTQGTTTILEYNGLKYLIFSGIGAYKNPLQNEEFYNIYPEYCKAWFINLDNGMISQGTLSADSLSVNICSDGNGLYLLDDTQDDSVNISANIVTGKLDFGMVQKKRITDAYIGKKGGKLVFTIYDKSISSAFHIIQSTDFETAKVNLPKGLMPRYHQFSLSNLLGSEAIVDNLELEVIPLSRRV